jgi:NitT/TauT family transport system permease protein
MAYLEEARGPSAAEPVTGKQGNHKFPQFALEQWLPLLMCTAIIIGWEFCVAQRWLSALFLPAPSTIAQTFIAQILRGTLPAACLATLLRMGSGLLLGGGSGLVLGLLLGWSSLLRRLFDPWVAALHAVPKISILPLFMIIFGIGETSKLMVIAFSTFFPMLINTMAGVQQIASVYWEVAHNYGASRTKLFRRVIIPGSLPFILTGLRLALNTALLLTVAVELVSAKDGLGAMIWLAWQTLRVAELYVALFVIALLGLGFLQLGQKIEQWLLPWQNQ